MGIMSKYIPKTNQQRGGNIYVFFVGTRLCTFEILRSFEDERRKKIFEGIDYVGGALACHYPASFISKLYHPHTRQFIPVKSVVDLYYVGEITPDMWNIGSNFCFSKEQMKPLRKIGGGYRVADEAKMRPRKKDGFEVHANLRLSYREFGGGYSDIDVWIDRSEGWNVLHHLHCKEMSDECYETLLAQRVRRCIDLDTGDDVDDIVKYLKKKRVPSEKK